MTLLLLALDAAARPTDFSGLFSFDESDKIVTLDGDKGLVRIWYSIDGPNETRLDDDDKNGVPDFVEFALATTEGALELYEALGFRLPLGDEGAGGSDAFDAYLVDFDGLGDGAFTPESCSSVGSAEQCSGYFAMENDFSGYGYPSVEYAIETVAPHELFHAVQAAYDAGEESWWSEGTATWAEQLYVPESPDFLGLCDYYLDDPGRSLDSPPSGPVPAWSYGTALWWWFLADAHGTGAMVEMLEASESSDELLVDMAALIEAHGSTLADEWIRFTDWNLATGSRSGAMESYPFADELGLVASEEETGGLVTLHRFYPLAATYFPFDHAGGLLWIAADADAPSVTFLVHPTDAGGDVEEAIGSWIAGPTPQDVGDLAAGRYWLVGTNPTLDEDSTHVTLCFGDLATATACAPKDTGGADTGDSGGTPDDDEDDGGCSCGGGSPSSLVLVLLVSPLVSRLRGSAAQRRRGSADHDQRTATARRNGGRSFSSPHGTWGVDSERPPSEIRSIS